ncbi:DUF4190 domain-containing protein [Herbiconiux sp.]|uniref:DUF4190 domain-containing protein n=1 Tax=Herbiconiux sp. TaxID=1871186 RepID=UPI0025BF9EF1|nr:DUF4190 domain-containing protein [Herbiconiux sp.]
MTNQTITPDATTTPADTDAEATADATATTPVDAVADAATADATAPTPVDAAPDTAVIARDAATTTPISGPADAVTSAPGASSKPADTAAKAHATKPLDSSTPFVATAAQPTVPLGDKAALVAAAAPASSYSTPAAAPAPAHAPTQAYATSPAYAPTPPATPTPVGGYSSAPAAPTGGVVAGGPGAGAGAGASATVPQYYPEAPRTNTLGIVTLVLGILGFGLVPVITGHIALGQIKKNRDDGYGITLAGLILGYVTLAGWILVAAFWIGAAGIALFGAFAASAA